MPNLYDGYYINLDRSPERRANMERQFAALGLGDTYRRFPAIDGTTLPPRPGIRPGERGIFRSHYAVVEAARASGRPIHILEDDAIFSPAAAPAIDLFIRAKVLDKYDIIFTETLVPQDLRAIKQFKMLYDQAMGTGTTLDLSKMQIIDLADVKFACASSYVVNPNSVERILAAYKRGWDLGPAEPFDFFLRHEVNAGRLKAACSFPFVTTVDLAGIMDTTSGRPTVDNPRVISAMVMTIVRYSFFVGRDLDRAYLRLQEILAQTSNQKPDRHRVLLEKALGYVLSDHFALF